MMMEDYLKKHLKLEKDNYTQVYHYLLFLKQDRLLVINM